VTCVGGCNETHANSSVESQDEDDNVGGKMTVKTPNKVCGCLCAVLQRTVWVSKGAGCAVQKVPFKDLIKSELKIVGNRGMFFILE
jgi:hypothetical protein